MIPCCRSWRRAGCGCCCSSRRWSGSTCGWCSGSGAGRADRADDVRPGHPAGPDLAAAPRGRSVHPQSADPDRGVRQAQGPGVGAAGAGDDRGHHRHLAVDGGAGRRAEPAGCRQGRGRAVRQHACRRSSTSSLVTFAGTATTVVPPTLDRGAVTAAIQSLRPQASTAIGEGIYTSLAALAQVPPDPDNPNAVPPARIVLLSDGKTQVGRPSDQAAQAAKAQSVPIYTIAYGTADGYIEIGGRREPVPVDRAELARVSQDLRRRGVHRNLGRGAQGGLQGHRQLGRQGEGRQRGDLPLRRLRSGLRHPRRDGHDLPRRPLAVRAEPLGACWFPMLHGKPTRRTQETGNLHRKLPG